MAFASLVSSPGKKVNRKNKNKFDGLHLYKGKWRVQVTLDKGFNNAEDAQRYRKSLISHIKKRPETTNNNEDVAFTSSMGNKFNNRFTTRNFPVLAEANNGDSPSNCDFLFTFALFSINTFTTAVWPSREEEIKAVSPSSLIASTLHPNLHNK